MSDLVHVVVDLETLGLEQDAVVLSLGASTFRMDGSRPKFDKMISEGFYAKFDVKEQVKTFKRTMTDSTIDWWKTQGAAAKKVLEATPFDHRMADGLIEFNAWLKKVGYNFQKSYIWSRGTYFDFPKIEHMYRQAEVECGYNGWKIRDVRTYIDILTGVDNGKYEPEGGTPQQFVAHDALHDAAMDGYRMQEIFNKMSEE
ncbi:exonuclease [Stenotrophomonas phage Mendera]|uniref:Exonuclease n=2 Tax=Menderavirus TaxID=2843421 RepID=A0A5P8PIR2_9CAUD|nr:exonuclease [Stenotrophomonas phage Mendera]YP_010667645.1 exonuclease [Stenotrophomonas maltophilia phage vB_SmaM_Ps15]QXN67441.1 exonuclease [Stenotrophomonas phage BUCT608]QYW02616.1 exonuclease [Stenotrophomonas phage Marzo]QFR56617.1 exonuclease [Stenotrophomonas phage Mendera]QYC97579.1 hypothetical protein [Stenotrophomonas phage BUCT608]UMO77317.1 exonuclease A [Stenotrophomonas maltophilia phage vB_SmaM_Ps15]